PPPLRRRHAPRRAPEEPATTPPVTGADPSRSKLMASSTLSSIPFQGSGLGYRSELKKHVWEHRSEIDCLEVITDRYTDNPHLISELEELCDSFRVIPHGVRLSIGSPDLDVDYVRQVRRICEITKTPYYSEHLCMTRAAGIEI